VYGVRDPVEVLRGLAASQGDGDEWHSDPSGPPGPALRQARLVCSMN
jgi:hypothetical protein